MSRKFVVAAKATVVASIEDKFWDLHDKDYDTGIALENIIDKLSLSDKFFDDSDGDIHATEADYQKVLDYYEGAHPEIHDHEETAKMLIDAGFHENWVDGDDDASICYYSKGKVGVIVGDIDEIRLCARSLS